MVKNNIDYARGKPHKRKSLNDIINPIIGSHSRVNLTKIIRLGIGFLDCSPSRPMRELVALLHTRQEFSDWNLIKRSQTRKGFSENRFIKQTSSLWTLKAPGVTSKFLPNEFSALFLSNKVRQTECDANFENILWACEEKFTQVNSSVIIFVSTTFALVNLRIQTSSTHCPSEL